MLLEEFQVPCNFAAQIYQLQDSKDDKIYVASKVISFPFFTDHILQLVPKIFSSGCAYKKDCIIT